ncbi:MAG: energy transducer TonB, partial [Bacteroidales bacterium]
MEIKKSAKADLEKKKSLYMQIGLVFTLAVLLLAFDWKSYDKVNIEVTSHAVIQADEDLVIQTDQSAPPPPPPPADMSTEIDIVENNVKIEKEVEINAEADEKTVVQTVSYVAPSVE